MLVGVGRVELFLPEVHSLKEKRSILLRLRERTARRFHIPVSEVGHQDLWQRAEVGFAIVGSDRKTLSSLLQRIGTFLRELDSGQIVAQDFEVIDFNG